MAVLDRVKKKGELFRVEIPHFHLKKNGTVQFLSNFRKLNQRIRRKPFPITKIKNMLLNIEGFMYASYLDLNTGYYQIEL